MLIVQQQFNKVQVLYADNLVVFSLKQPLVAHTGKCLVTQTVQKLGTLAHDKEVCPWGISRNTAVEIGLPPNPIHTP